MHNTFEDIREQIHEIRNLLGPIDIKLDNLDHKISASRISFESSAADLHAKIAAESLRITQYWDSVSNHSVQLAQQFERIRRIESLLKIPEGIEKPVPVAPVHEDKLNPEVIPPQKPQV
ncbi:MAG: hypothetical protein ACREE6_17555 [Limisphaerales bacterium]